MAKAARTAPACVRFQRVRGAEGDLSLGGGLRASMADDDEDYSLTCPICLELLTNPVMLPCCQQTYCKRCLRLALNNSGKCPLCRAPAGMELSLPNRALEGLLALRKGRDIESAIPHWPARRRAFLPERVRACVRREAATGAGLPGACSDSACHRRARQVAQVRGRSLARWWAEHAPCVRCACVVVSVCVLMLFLRVEEEEYARQNGDLGRFHAQTGYLPALTHHIAVQRTSRLAARRDDTGATPRHDNAYVSEGAALRAEATDIFVEPQSDTAPGTSRQHVAL